MDKIEDRCWIKFLAPEGEREKLKRYAAKQGKTYAQILREYIEHLPDLEVLDSHSMPGLADSSD
jgi:predicted DNA-binding protein